MDICFSLCNTVFKCKRLHQDRVGDKNSPTYIPRFPNQCKCQNQRYPNRTNVLITTILQILSNLSKLMDSGTRLDVCLCNSKNTNDHVSGCSERDTPPSNLQGPISSCNVCSACDKTAESPCSASLMSLMSRAPV